MKKLIVYILFLYPLFGIAQTSLNYIDIKSPGITDFIKYGNLSSTSYTGNLDYEIPIISTPTNRTNPISISLKYDASGFRPSKRSGLVGLNWFLNMGGAITRQINGMPDDQMGEPTVNGARKPTNGFIIGVRNKIHNETNVFNLSSSDVYNNTLNLDFYLFANSTNTQLDANNYEGDPDIFNFNFNGITGSFFMGNDGVLKVTTNQPNNLKIDISGMQNQLIVNNSSIPRSSLIVITDNEGNKYYFGGETKNLEYTANNMYPIITTWHMCKVEYSNGSVTNFNFRSDTSLSLTFDSPADNSALHAGFPIISDNTTQSPRDFCVLNEYVSDERSIYDFGSNGNLSSGGIGLTTTLQKIAILDQIVDDSYVINFTYSRQQHKFNTRNSSTDNYPVTPLYGDFIDIELDKIEIYAKNGTTIGNLIKKIDFGYTYMGESIHSRMFLSSLTENGKPPYQFEYNDASVLPKPITFGIDHWGFWNGNNDNYNQLIPYQNYQSNGDYSDCTATGNTSCTPRNPSFLYASKGILNKVVYPTGGYTRFEYEPHAYSNRLEVKSVNNYVPALYNITDVGGGCRIKRIVDSADGLTETNIKSYEYKTDAGISSGVLLSWPRYTIHWTIPPGNLTASQTLIFIRSNPIGRHIMDIPILTYSQVSEITTDNGKIVTNFTDFVSNPDDNTSNFLDHSMGVGATPLNLGRNYMGYFLNDKSIERGKRKTERIFDNLNGLKSLVNYVYNTDLLKTNKFSAKLHLSGPSVQSNKMYYYNDYLTEKNSTIYNASGSIVSTEKYVYTSIPSYSTLVSNQDILSKKNSLTSINNELLETQYKYPSDIYTTGSTNYINFQTANIVAPLRESQFRNGVKLSENFTVYSKDATTNNLLLPKFVYGGKFPNNYMAVTDVGTLEKKVTYDLYETKGNISQYTQENGVPVTILWGYNKTLPIAKIENATLAQVANALAVSTTVLQGYNEVNLTTTVLNGLRTNLSTAMITTYTHIPLVGVNTITDPKGDVMTYTYDASNRLLNIKDKNGNVLSQYTYHYKNQ